ncbi:hypothetical protein HRM2_25310 [Desulforapulum autotrophicum HRM2]|uniref:Polysaccharide pyruvyl transferase domain-containing protein n=1 Tax=Desulforapulum autotrophicum (strain ATCC 43914 / DSM 3382 / VKM B-1955 / HRM2) TaxID=177437 RepID=C0QGX6_DESAH|nr:polysaccharide pyruvyl transferase family protein [Desulforapulum autotrophicum]ACN15625.1 hypothetical protein HRM2_25310 [Desulforapulum autotrophicum HRM2]
MIKSLIFYKTTAAVDNTGEVLIYKSLLEQLRQYGDVIVDDRHKMYAMFHKWMGVENNERLSRFSDRSFIASMILEAIKGLVIKRQVAFVTGVGEHKYTTIKSAVKNLLAACFLALLKVLRVKVVRIGMSIQLAGRLTRDSEKILSIFVDHYYVRDSLSQEHCLKAGIKKVKVAPDLSWGYAVNQNSWPKNSTQITNIMFSFRSSIYNDDLKKIESLKVAIRFLADYINSNFDCNIYISYQVTQDKAFAEEVCRYLAIYFDNISFVKEQVTLDNAAEYYGNANVVFSNRLHALLLAYKFGALPIGIIDVPLQQKIVGIFKDIGFPELLYHIDEIKSISISENDIDETVQAIKNVEKNNTRILNEIFVKIFKP